MGQNWTFGRKVGLGFAAVVALAVALGAVAVYALRAVTAAKDRVIEVDAQQLIDAEAVTAALERKSASLRAFLLMGTGKYLDDVTAAREEFSATLERLRAAVRTDEGRAAVDGIGKAEAAHRAAADSVIALKKSGAAVEEIERVFDAEMAPKRVALRDAVKAFVVNERALLDAAKTAASDSAASAITLVMVIAAGALLLAFALALVLTRSLGRQIGTAVGQVQSSSGELQAAATQQATGAKEQSTAMAEITTTISELLATSRQIAESAQRVARIAGDTAGAARSGQATVERADEAVGAIRRQVELIVGHMLDLGKKSQQIGAVLEIVAELAEQTNILAINATIEAAGAGEAGRRFAVVADEIRKLSDRVASSTKEIRGLIDDVRGAVNTTVMATESGAKAVDSGTRQFADVASAFKQIVDLISTTTEAAREIELSTKQQTTAVEQVNQAIANVAQATRETEASSGQTLQTASQLAALSRDLHLLVRPAAAA
ncbi:MAG TPA: methyl-accepting chemotaxis protein [Myxococcota bacterium]|jgi:methyl-accepting chemotaxis protein|nr:methyl-accepting chemotaxis protein [Myxococcota bacterium]